MKLFKLVDGGSLKEGGYIRLSLVLPSYTSSKTMTIIGTTCEEKKLSFPTKITLTKSSFYNKILFSVLGFGLCLEAHESIN